ncbi:hypothetical protein D6777_03785 [Candidatus Woesearchaeota archaeon]|nr:MAG: hypothetical protein D6777_03785 [Candidatus Woesearchaeota archaeon]
MENERTFIVKFTIINDNIQTQMHNKNVTPQEAIGLLEMAKSQILENLAKNRKEVFSGSQRL